MACLPNLLSGIHEYVRSILWYHGRCWVKLGWFFSWRYANVRENKSKLYRNNNKLFSHRIIKLNFIINKNYEFTELVFMKLCHFLICKYFLQKSAYTNILSIPVYFSCRICNAPIFMYLVFSGHVVVSSFLEIIEEN